MRLALQISSSSAATGRSEEHTSELQSLMRTPFPPCRPSDLIARTRKPGAYHLMTWPDPDHPVRRREGCIQRLLKLPGVGALLAASQWKEGAAYLRISRNRPPLAQWHAMLNALGFADIVVQCSDRQIGRAHV